MLAQLERARPGVEAELAAGRQLAREPGAPGFVQLSVDEVDGRLRLVDDLAKQRYAALKVCHSLIRLSHFSLFHR